MRVQFEITADEMVDVSLRALERSATYRAQRTRGVLVTAFITGLLSFFALFFVAADGSLGTSLLVAGVSAILGGVVQLFTDHSSTGRRLRAYCEEQLGTDEPVNFQVELTREHILTEGQGTQVAFAWPNVEEIAETDDSIDFYMRHGGLVVMRKRAFGSTEEMRRFLALAAEYRAAPRSFAAPDADA